MSPWARVVFGIGSTTAVVAVVHYCYLAIANPARLAGIGRDDEDSSYPPLSKSGIYMLLVFIGSVAICSVGFRGLFSWMPETWGTEAEDGDFAPVSDGLGFGLGVMAGMAVIYFLGKLSLDQLGATGTIETLEAEVKSLKAEVFRQERANVDLQRRLEESSQRLPPPRV